MDSRKLKLLLNTLLILAFLVVARDYVSYKSKSRSSAERVAELEEEIAALRREAAALRERVGKLESDPATIERLARDRLGMRRPDEEIIRPDTMTAPKAGKRNP